MSNEQRIFGCLVTNTQFKTRLQTYQISKIDQIMVRHSALFLLPTGLLLMGFAYRMRVFLYPSEFYGAMILGTLFIPLSLIITSIHIRSRSDQSRAITTLHWRVNRIRALLDEKVSQSNV